MELVGELGVVLVLGTEHVGRDGFGGEAEIDERRAHDRRLAGRELRRLSRQALVHRAREGDLPCRYRCTSVGAG